MKRAEVGLAEIARQWLRIGVIGFGGPPAHISLLRDMCVERHGWMTPQDFQRAVAMANILPGPASTQVAIYCAWWLRGTAGALLGGLCFIAPGLVAIIALATVFLSSSPPQAVLAAGLGAGSAVAAVALRAGLDIARPIVHSTAGPMRLRSIFYALAGAGAAATLGPLLAAVLVICGLLELASERGGGLAAFVLVPLRPSAVLAVAGGIGALAWTALKVGALSFGGGFVIVPLMQADAVSVHHWMTHSQFLNAVALGQVTPGPVLQTVAVVGYAAGGLGGALLAAAVAFAPSFLFVLAAAPNLERVVADRRASAFLAGAGAAAAGAIMGAAIPLATALAHGWQFALLGASLVALLIARRSIVLTLLASAGAGVVLVAAGAPGA